MTDLGEWSIFGGLDVRDIEQILAIARKHRYRVDDRLMHDDDVADSVYLIERGHTLVERVTFGGDLVAVAVRGPHEVVGESALVLEGGRRGATVRALTPVEALLLRASDFEALRQERPSVDRLLVAMLAERNRSLTNQLTEQRFVSVADRVLRQVARLHTMFGRSVPLPQHVVAALAGTTRASANAVLRSLEEAGKIELKRGRFEVLDSSVLEVLDDPV